jgi:hypothetical protein
MIKGLAITPPLLGRISIGRVVIKNGKRLPEKDDQFTLTTQIQNQEGWIPHPLDEELRKDSRNNKIRTIPVTLLFNDPDLNFRAEYSLFDKTNGRPLCAGNGDTCRRHTQNGVESLPCPSPAFCDFAKQGQCKPYGRLNVKVGDDDELGTFIFRTTGYNSIRTLAARLSYFKAVSGDLLSCLPLELRLRGKSTTQSYRKAIYYVDITVREGMTLEEAIAHAKATDTQRKDSGFNQHDLDIAAEAGFNNATYEDTEEELSSVIEEFYPAENQQINSAVPQASTTSGLNLSEKLKQKASTTAQQVA